MAKATGKNHAEINLDIWGDDDWLDLSPPAQHLYFVLWTSPELSHCGCGPWHPGRIAAKARGWTPGAVEAAAAELSAELFLIIDTITEEFDLRSWIKHDGIWRKPNMAVAMANARAGLASRTLRGVVVHEVAKIKARNIAEATKENPASTSWDRDVIKELLKQKPVDPASLPPFTPSSTPPPTPGLTQRETVTETQSLTVNPNPSPNPPADPTPTPTPTPFSYSISPEGLRNRGTSPGRDPDPNTPPPDHCPQHPGGTDKPCRACGELRIARRAFDDARRATAEQRRRQFLAEIETCDECDPHGWALAEDGEPLEPAVRCDEHDWSLTHA